MKKLFLLSLFLLFLCSPAFALLVTDNVDRDKFQYEIGYTFSTDDIGASKTAIEIPNVHGTSQFNFYYVIPRDARIVGMSTAGSQVCTVGSATFDVTINGTVTGIQNVVDEGASRSAVGNSGSTGSQYSYIRQDRAEDIVSRGFRPADDKTDIHDTTYPYGKATPLSAGNRIGVKVTTSSNFTPTNADYVITVYVLQ